MQGKLFLSQFLEAKASRARGHSGHEAPPMTHSLLLKCREFLTQKKSELQSWNLIKQDKVF